MIRDKIFWLLLLLLAACLSETPVALSRATVPDGGPAASGSTSAALSNEGSGAVIVKYTADGVPFRCWLASGVFVEVVEHQLVQWVTYQGNRVQITAPFVVVIVPEDAWGDAFAQLGLSRETCLTLNRSVYLPDKGWILPANEIEPPPSPLMPRAKRIKASRHSGRVHR